MSLTSEDLYQIRIIVEEVVEPLINPVHGEVIALRNDVKEIYGMVANLQSGVMTDKTLPSSH